MGASNELPESEELDALYDRFLIRRKVRQVSLEGLTALLGDSPQAQRDAFFNKSGNGANGSAAPPPVDLSTEDFSRVRCASAPAVTPELYAGSGTEPLLSGSQG